MELVEGLANIGREGQEFGDFGSIFHPQNFIPDRDRGRSIRVSKLGKLRMASFVLFEPSAVGLHVLPQFFAWDDGLVPQTFANYLQSWIPGIELEKHAIRCERKKAV